MTRPPRVLVCAGEPSGDRHAADLVRALRAACPHARIGAVGGPHLAASGVEVCARAEGLGAVGAVQPVTTLFAHLALLARLRHRLRERRDDLVILVDYPGLNLRVARLAAAVGIPVLYYIAPQAWAWAPGRTELLRRTVRSLAVVLPFEEAFFSARGVRAKFVGHPLLDTTYPPREAARATLGFAARSSVLGLFPGSRPSEVRRLWPRLREAARRAGGQHAGLTVTVAAVPGCTYPDAAEFRLVWGRSAEVLAAADVVLCKSGTTALETAIVGVPSVVAYVADPVSYALGRRLVRAPFIGLANLVAGAAVVPELLQQAATPERLAAAVLPLMNPDGSAARRQRAAYATIRTRLGSPGAARRTAELALDLVA